MIRQNHVFRDTHKEGRDLVVVFVVSGRRHRDNCHGWFTVKEAREKCEVVVLSGSQRLKGADVFRSDIRAHVTIPPASRARSA